MKKKKTIKNILAHSVLTILAIVWVSPLFWILLTSFRAQKGAYTSSFFPKQYSLDNYVKLFTDTGILNFPRMFTNTLIVAVYYILKAVGLSEGAMIRVALVLVYSASSGIQFYIAKGFFDTIPKTIDEAAMIDGATKWQVFTKITIPLSKPIIVYTILTSFIAPWVDFIFARVICRANAKYYTVAIGLWQMLEKEYVDVWYTRFAAGAVLISIPIVALFMIMQRCYNESMTGAVKG